MDLCRENRTFPVFRCFSLQPDNSQGVEHCGSWYTQNPPASWATPDTWNDENCDNHSAYVCQGTGIHGN